MAPAWFKRREKTDPPAAAQKPSGNASSGEQAPPAAKAVPISRFLSEDLIQVLPGAKDKNQVIDKLVNKLCKARGLGDPAPLLRKVLEREQGISTTLDTGLSMPHARVDIPEIAVILALLPNGIPDPKQPEMAIRAMFLFFSPNRQEAFTQHLHLLRSVASLFQPAFIDQLVAAGSPAKALELVRKQETP